MGDNVQDVISTKTIEYNSLNNEIKRTMRRSARDMVQLGFLLRIMMDEKLWVENYDCFDSYLEQELRMSYSMANRFISANKKYSVGGCSKEIEERYKNYSQGVQIENLPDIEILSRYDTKDVFIYADPPYLPDIRKSHLYKHEMSYADHEQLLERLIKHPGSVMISGYDNDLYNNMLSGWRKEYKSTNAECGIKRTEVIWMNYDDAQINLFDIQGVMT